MIKETFKIKILAQSAKPTPPLGPMLGQRGINIKEFCDKFNSLSTKYRKDIICFVTVTLYQNGDYEIEIPSIYIDDIKYNVLSKKDKIKVLYHKVEEFKNSSKSMERLSIKSIFKSILK